MSPATKTSSSNYHQFFTVYQPQHCSNQLQIPREFEKRIGIAGKIPRRVILRNSEGKLWAVELLHKQGVGVGVGLFLLGGGWSKFAVDHSLSFGEFLVFKYNGHHVFDVLILGIDGCQRGLTAPQNHKQDNVDQDTTNSEFDQAGEGLSGSGSDYDSDYDHEYIAADDDDDYFESDETPHYNTRLRKWKSTSTAK